MPTNTADLDNEKQYLLQSSSTVREKDRHWCCIFQHFKVWIMSIIAMILFVLGIYLLNPSRDSHIFPICLLNTGDRIQLRSSYSSLYVRSDDLTGSLLLDQSIPWKRGSTFTVEARGECFLLRSLSGKYVSINFLGDVHAISSYRHEATRFSAVTKYQSMASKSAPKLFTEKILGQIHLKICEG